MSGRFRPFVRSRSPGGGTAPDLPAWTKLAPRAIAPTRTGLLGRRSLKAREVRFESLLGGPTSPRVRRFAGYGAGFGETDFACRTLARGRQTTGADAPLACLDEARRSRAKSGWEAGIRTPITWFRATGPTVERPPSTECRGGTNHIILSQRGLLQPAVGRQAFGTTRWGRASGRVAAPVVHSGPNRPAWLISSMSSAS